MQASTSEFVDRLVAKKAKHLEYYTLDKVSVTPLDHETQSYRTVLKDYNAWQYCAHQVNIIHV